MELVILQSLPGCGKSTIGQKLKKILYSSEYIEVDKFKNEILNEGETLYDRRIIAYEKTINLLNIYKHEQINYTIIDELFVDNQFINNINKYIQKNKLPYYWFRISRPINELLEIEKQRKRKVKNSLQDLLNLQKAIDETKVENLIQIQNSKTINLDTLVSQMFKIITK